MDKYERGLKKLLKTGKLSPSLKRAVQDTLKAYQKGDYALAYELSAVKSFIATGVKPSRRYHFVAEGNRAYNLLDDLHHRLASTVRQIPSGTAILTSQGVGRLPKLSQKGKPIRKHPIIALMEKEHQRIIRDVEKRNKRRRK